MGATGLGLLLEEHRSEIVSAWRQRVQHELSVAEPALAFAIAPLLREMSLALGSADAERRSREAWTRCAVLVRSTAGAAQLAREFSLLHRCLWESFRARDVPVSPADRGTADAWLDDALAEALDRLERVRLRVASLERAPVVIPPMGAGVAAGARKSRATPPPLPSRSRRAPSPQPRATHVSVDAITDIETLH